MISEFNFKLKNVGLINKADINIGKINVIGGNNSTGKSTSSKMLYSFLRSNSKNRKELTKNTLINDILEFSMDLNLFNNAHRDEENFNPIDDKIINFRNEIHQKQLDDENIDVIKYYKQIKESYDEYMLKYSVNDLLTNSFNNIKNLIEIYEDDDEKLFNSIMNLVIKSEFGKSKFENNEVIFSGNFNNLPFHCYGDIMNSNLKMKGFLTVENVFYLDSFSFFDLLSRGGSQNTEHVSHVFNSIEDDQSNTWADEIKNKNIIKIEEKLFEITGGTFVYDNRNIKFIKDDAEVLMKNTASGIKQVGVIQMLLNTRKLKQNSFLIIDEPEVNLHPEWQIKLAEVLTLLSKDLNIYIYINSHSPLFIEAIRTYAEKYDLLDETNFYLTYPSKEEKFDIEYVPTEDLNIIYNSLGEPYETLSEISIDNQFK